MISVIVTEYKKRGYLIHALRSVFNQTLSRDKYEVIVVKKEEDKEVDDYARKNGAKIIYDASKKYGENVYNALLEAKGDIISLLDDDDMFTQNKLEEVYHIFKEERVSGMRNAHFYIDSNNNILFNPINDNNFYRWFVNKYNYNHKKYFYLFGVHSCISIRRELIDEDIKYQNLIGDTYLMISAICKSEDMKALFYGKPLTYYRVHSQNTSIPRTLEDVVNLKKNYLEDEERIYNKFYSCGKEMRKTLKLRFLGTKLGYYLLSIYLTDKDVGKEFKFSLSDRIFLLSPFNKTRRKYITLGFLAAGFLSLPLGLRFRLFKFLQKHSSIINKMLEIQ